MDPGCASLPLTPAWRKDRLFLVGATDGLRLRREGSHEILAAAQSGALLEDLPREAMAAAREFVVRARLATFPVTALEDHEVTALLRSAVRNKEVLGLRECEGGARDGGAATVEMRQLIRSIEAQVGRSLSHGGRNYRLITDVDLDRLRDRDSYEVVGRDNAQRILAGLGERSGGVTGGLFATASSKLSRDWRPPLHPDGLVLLRRLPAMRTLPKDPGPALTPSQMKKMATKTDWIEIEVVDQDGEPYGGRYSIELSDGTTHEGSFGESGLYENHDLDPGNCKLTLLDRTKVKSGGGPPPVDPPADEFELVELIEIVVQDAEKFVKGAADETADTTLVTQSVERKDKDGANFKQYINLDPALEGAAKCHPEYGRVLRFRARVRQKNGKTDKLSGVKVVFKRERVDGPNRADPGGTEPAIFQVANLTAAQQDGFGSAGGGAETSSTTDANGWTSVVELYLSEFAGDQFKVSAELDPSVKGATGATPKKTKASYVVWRRFWYQMTYADGYAAQRPTAAEGAYAELFAEMVLASEKKFTKADLPADLQDRTFMPEFQLKQGGANSTVANVGDHSNIGEFSTNAKMNLDVKPEQPVKGNLIVCEYQCDPAGTSQLKDYKLTAAGQTITIAAGTGGSIISKPAIRAATDVVATGEWATTKTPWTKGGDITDANIEIVATRASTLAVKINLPAGAPTPTAANPVWVRLQLQTANNFLGWAAAGGIVAVYQPSAPAGSQGSLVDFNDTTSHEFGHKFNQTPRPTKQPDSLKNHPLQYVGHGGSGSHCRHAATVGAGTPNWQDPNEATPSPADGDCNMFHSYSASCSHKFCVVCKTYLQLQKMTSL